MTDRLSLIDQAQLGWSLVVMGWNRDFALVPGILTLKNFPCLEGAEGCDDHSQPTARDRALPGPVPFFSSTP